MRWRSRPSRCEGPAGTPLARSATQRSPEAARRYLASGVALRREPKVEPSSLGMPRDAWAAGGASVN